MFSRCSQHGCMTTIYSMVTSQRNSPTAAAHQCLGVFFVLSTARRPSRSFLFAFSSKIMGKDSSERREQVRPVCEKTMSALRRHSTALSLCKQRRKCDEDVTLSFIPHFFSINIPIICDGRHAAKLLVPVL